MKLIDLEAEFMQWREEPPTAEQIALNPTIYGDGRLVDIYKPVVTFAEAHGIMFICPKGKAAGDEHRILVWFRGSPVPDRLGKNKAGKTVRWDAKGTGLADLVLTPSIAEQSEHCGWHGFVGSNGVPPGEAR